MLVGQFMRVGCVSSDVRFCDSSRSWVQVGKGHPYRHPSLLLAGVTAILIGLGLLVFHSLSSSPPLEHLLGAAYHEERTLDLRIARTAHSPMRTQLGQDSRRDC